MSASRLRVLARVVPDPYYGGSERFETVLDLCEAAADGVIAEVLSI